MNTSLSSVSLIYLMSLLVFFNLMNSFLFWMLMEINTLCFLVLLFRNMEINPKVDVYGVSLFYFLVQSFGSSIFMFSFCFSSGDSFYFPLLLDLAFFLKLSLFPFYFWMCRMGESLSSFSFWVLLTLQKIPLFILLFSFKTDSCFLLLFLSLASGPFLIFSSTSLFDLLIFSSVYSSFWIIFMIFSSFGLFFSYFFFYSIFSLLIFLPSLHLSNTGLDYVFFLCLFLFFLALPPLSFFFFKIFVLNFFLLSASMIHLTLMWILTLGSLVGYLKFFFSSIFLSHSLTSLSLNFLPFLFLFFFSSFSLLFCF